MKYDPLFALLRRRGVLWPAAEIYGGASGLFDYGPLGTALKRRLEDAWRAWFLGLSEDYHWIEPAEILPEAVVRASGHLENFTDPEVTCGKCGHSFRADVVLEKVRPNGIDGLSPTAIAALLREAGSLCPHCGNDALSVPRPFNLMFGLDFGPTGRERAYLRPETAQSSFLAFARMWEVGRRALPLGVAVIGRAYRNEIAPRQALFRMRAFTQAELQIFFDPGAFEMPLAEVADLPLPILSAADRERGAEGPTSRTPRELVDGGSLPGFYAYHLAISYRFYRDVLGYPAASLRLLEKSDAERAFYNKIQFDIEAHLESLGGFKELGAVHYRGDYDLGRHAEGSQKDLSVAKQAGGRVLPHVLELTFGVDRNLWALADRHLVVEPAAGDETRTVWKLPPYLAPVAVGVFPLLKKEHAGKAREIARTLGQVGIAAEYDAVGSIGKRYARMDEAGVPYCITVDGETLDPTHPNHGTVTVRDRDSKSQRRVAVPELAGQLAPGLLFPRVGPG
ncbi:MAG TPA: glycine--tRNA ligase [Thermoplasmata archaeon]|nr:glycine--tRNA ligase [Thermoplasmata archaeon]